VGAFLGPLVILLIGIVMYKLDSRCGLPSDSGGCEMGIFAGMVMAIIPGAVVGYLYGVVRGFWKRRTA
jgi:hypothetical protein